MRYSAAWKKADIFRRVPRDLTEATLSGAVISILCVGIMTLLFAGEVISYVFPRTNSDMMVSHSRTGDERLRVFIDMDLHRLPCALTSLDIEDALGNHQVDASENLKKIPITPTGVEIRDGRGSDEFKNQLEGCRLQGFFHVAKVPGNFHISAHHKTWLVNQYFPSGIHLDHTIRQLAFEPSDAAAAYARAESGSRPLEGVQQRHPEPAVFLYFLDVVPTSYVGALTTTDTYQYTFGKKVIPIGQHGMALIKCSYQLSPIAVRYSSGRVSFTHFLTYICAIVGGVYTVAGLLSRFIYSSTAEFQKRFMGKSD